MRYQRIIVSTGANVGPVRPLPIELQGLTDEDLANLDAAVAPEALAQLGYVDAGFLPVADPPPEPPRAQLPKSTVTARLRAIGKFDAVWALLQANPDMFDKWYTPDWPNVFADDERMLQALAAVGLSESEIASVVAL